MKANLYFLAVFCLLLGALLSVTATTAGMGWFMLAWSVMSCAVFGGLAAVFPEH